MNNYKMEDNILSLNELKKHIKFFAFNYLEMVKKSFFRNLIILLIFYAVFFLLTKYYFKL